MRKKEISAEILPLDIAVKNTEVKILNPANRYPMEKIIKAVVPISKAGEAVSINMPTITSFINCFCQFTISCYFKL